MKNTTFEWRSAERQMTISGGSNYLAIRLNENPTIGYCWEVEPAGGPELIGENSEKAGNAIWAGGVEIFQFCALAPCLTGLRLKNGVNGGREFDNRAPLRHHYGQVNLRSHKMQIKERAKVSQRKGQS